MAALHRLRSQLFGFPGGPGVATMYFQDGEAAVAAVHDFWDALSVSIPLGVKILVEPSGDIIDDATGDLTGSWFGTPVAEVDGLASVLYAAPAGLLYSWETSTILDGHRVRGRTFIVPLSSSEYATDGSIKDSSLASFRATGTSMVVDTADNFTVWHRPRAAKAADGSRPAITARSGGQALVTSSKVPDRVCILRSRRA